MNQLRHNISWISDLQWYLALSLGGMFWLLYGYFFQPFTYNYSLFELEKFVPAIILYPLVEEIVFRGWLQGGLLGRAKFSKRWARISLANVTSSLLFALLHALYQPFLWALLIFIPSLVFGYFRERHSSLYPCIALHALYNLGFLYLFGS